MNQCIFNELDEILKKYGDGFDYKEFVLTEEAITSSKKLFSDIQNYFDSENRIKDKAILGIDIYKYSRYPKYEQLMIPVLFTQIVSQTIHLLWKKEPYFFKINMTRKKMLIMELLDNKFIPTGDGGFFVFDTPIHALVFAIYFQYVLTLYNAYRFRPSLRLSVKGITCRFALTFDEIICYDRNYFGPAIINNSRIMANDSLNRFLIDTKTNEWFLMALGGVELLQHCDKNTISSLSCFENIPQAKTELFENNLIKQVNIEKIGIIENKNTNVDIYNIQSHVIIPLENQDVPIIVNLGNLNTEGLTIK